MNPESHQPPCRPFCREPKTPLRENTSRNTHRVVAEEICGQPDVHRVLDVPSGEGAFTRRLMNLGYEVRAADCVNILRVPGVRFDVCDMNHPLPFHDGEFDAVACIDGIEHLERPFDFVREVGRILRRSGSFVISTPNISSLRSRWRWLLTGFHNKCKRPLNEATPSPLHHIGMLSFPEVRYLLHANGFRIDSIRTNRVKAVNWIYLPLVPVSWLVTRAVLDCEEKDPGQRERNRAIIRQMFSKAVLFGETLIVRASRSA